MTIPEPTYITEADVASNTLIEGLSSLSAENRKKLIKRAESQIDKYVRMQPHHPDDTNTDRVFPREQDSDDQGYPIIPLAVSEACLAQVEHLYLKWWSTRTTSAIPVNKGVASESIGGDGSYSATYSNDGESSSADILCDQAKAFLEGLVSRFVQLSVTDPDDVPTPS